MKKFIALTLFKKNFLLGSSCLLLALWGVTFVQISTFKLSYIESLKLNSRGIIAEVEQRLIIALNWDADFEEISQENMEMFTQFMQMGEFKNKLTQIGILDVTGRILVHTSPEKIGSRLPAATLQQLKPRTTITLKTGQSYDSYVPFIFKNRLYGYFVVGFNASLVEDGIEEVVKNSISITLVVLLITSLIFTVSTRLFITGPLSQIVEKIHYIKESGDLSVQVEVNTNDEIRDLAEHFNSMTADLNLKDQTVKSKNRELRARERELESLNAELEEKVNSRTSQLKQAKDFAERAREEAEKALAAESRFLATMSHEIRTPLNGVLVMAELLANTELKPNQKDFLDIIDTSGKFLLEVINDILDYSKIREGELELETVPTNLENVMEKVFDIVSHAAVKKDLDLIFDFENHNNLLFQSDPVRLKQIFVNLINNAIKFTEFGEISVISQLKKLDKYTDLKERMCEIQFSVSDTGIGIPYGKQSTLFKAFSQVDRSTTREFGGSGLGLAICESMIKLMGGKIWVESVVGEGASFYFTIQVPLITDDVKENPQFLEPLKSRTVLLIDEDQKLLKKLDRLCNRWHCETVVWEVGTPAGKLGAYQSKVDLVILNGEMKKKEPFDLWAELSKKGSFAQTPVIFLSKQNIQLESKVVNGVKSYQLLKPVKNKALLKMMALALTEQDWDEKMEPGSKFPDLARDFPLRILIAEDNLINQRVARATFKVFGYEIDLVENGHEVLSILTRNSYDIIFLDMRMPGMDGIETAIKIRGNSNINDKLPLIAMTANATLADQDKCFSAGMDDFVSKPLNMAHLSNVIKKWAHKSPGDSLPSKRQEEELKVPGMDENAIIDSSWFFGLRKTCSLKVFNEVASIFFKEVPGTMTELRKALSERDLEGGEVLAHKLKGTCLTVGAMVLAKRFHQIEENIRNADLKSVENNLETIEPLKESTFAEVNRLIGELPG